MSLSSPAWVRTCCWLGFALSACDHDPDGGASALGEGPAKRNLETDAGTGLHTQPDANARRHGETDGVYLTCSALTAKYRSCDLVGEGDFDCIGHMDACVTLCEIEASCTELADWLCLTLGNDSPMWRCVFDCAAGPGGYICESDGLAIPNDRFCDGVADCSDGSDENQCPATVCTIDWRTIVPAESLCDGVDDCFDGTDEEECPEFVCDDGSTQEHSVRCDGWEDCFDGSDEWQCDEQGRGDFACADGSFVSSSAPCDGVDECPDGSDELGCESDATGAGSDEGDFDRCNGFRDRDDWSDEADCCDDPPCAELALCSEPKPD